MTGTALDTAFERLHAKVASDGQLFPSEISECLNFAVDANMASRSDLTIKLLTPLAVRASNYPGLWQLLGLAYREEQQLDLALEALARAKALAPQDARVLAGHAMIAFELGLPSATLFREARLLDPTNLELGLSAAASLVAEDKAQVACGLLERTVEQFPSWVRGIQALATLRWTQGEGEEALIRTYEKAITRSPKNVALHLASMNHLVQLKEFDRLAQKLSEARSSCGELAEFDAIEAVAAFENGDVACGGALLQRLGGLEDAGVQLYQIRHALVTGDIARAEAFATKLQQTPSAAAAWPYMSLIWRLTGDARAQWLDGDPPLFMVFDLDFDQAELDRLADCLRRLHTAKAPFLEQSVRGGTQTDGNLLLRHDSELRSVRAKIKVAVRDYIQALPAFDESHPLLGRPRNDVRFAGSWSVRLAGSGFHVAHTHTHGWISSAMYVALPDAESLGPAPSGWLELGSPPPELGLDLTPYARVEPKPGRLVLFPSTMWHATVPFEEGERLTIAFDVAKPRR